MNEDQKLLAKLIGEAAAFEKAVQTLINSPQAAAGLEQVLKTNLTMRRQYLGRDIADAGLPEEALPIATAAAVAAEVAVFRGVQSGKYVPLR